MSRTITILCLLGSTACGLGPRVADPPDAPLPPDAPPPMDGVAPFVDVLPPGTVVPSVETNAELLVQIRINDGLVDATLAANNNEVRRGTGKAGDLTVRHWNFGPAPVETGIAVVAPLYVFGTLDENNVFTPSTEHPRMIDTLPGDIRYSPIRRVVNVAFTPAYNGEVITTVAALGEALERGLINEPVNDGTWVNMPVVLPGVTLEVADGVVIPSTKVLARGFVVDVFELGLRNGRQPFRNGFLPLGQASGLQTGVPLGNGSLPTAIDGQLVFQFAIPPDVPVTAFSYSPIATDITVRLSANTPPSEITSDGELFTRNATGAITGFFPGMVASFTIQTTVNNIQLQFTEGMP